MGSPTEFSSAFASGSNLVDKFAPDTASIRLTTSTYGKGVALVWGQAKLTGNVLVAHGVNMMFAPALIIVGGSAYALCEGPIVGFRRAWDFQSFYQNVAAIPGSTRETFLGTYSQEQSLVLTGAPANQPPLWYRGLAYAAFLDQQATAKATLRNYSFELAGLSQVGSIAARAKTVTPDFPTSTFSATAHGFAEHENIRLTSSGTVPAGLSAGADYVCANVSANAFQLKLNPWDAEVLEFTSNGSGTITATPFVLDASLPAVLTEFLTAEKFGAGFPSAQIGSLTALADYCMASGTFFSPILDSSEQASAFVERLALTAFSGVFFSEGLLKAVPYCDTAITGNGVTYTPNVNAAYDLTDDDFLHSAGQDPILVKRKSPSDICTLVRVQYQNRFNHYSDETVEVRDEAAILKYGLRPKDTVQLKEVKDPAVAKWIASLILFRELSVLKTYSFRLPSKYLLLEPMDILTLTESTGTPLDDVPVRVTRTAEQDDGAIQVEAEDFPIGTAIGVVYPHQGVTAFVPGLNVNPGSVNAPIWFVAPYLLSSGVLQLWIGIGGGAEYGGCEIWGSYDDPDGPYDRLGSLPGKSTTGALTSNLPAVPDPDNSTVLGVDLSESAGVLESVTAQQAANGDASLCYVGGELFSFTNVAETAPNRYNLTNLRRGLYGTPVSASASGSLFMFVHGAVFKLTVPPEFTVGRTLYLKFLAFNRIGAGTQSLGDVSPYAVDLGDLFLPAPTNVALASGTTELLLQGDGTVVPRIKVTWTPVSFFGRVTGYEIQFKRSSDSAWSDVPAVLGQAANTAWIAGVLSGVNHDVRIRAVGAAREASAWATIANHFVVGKTAKPADVAQFTIEGTVLTWSPVSDVDVFGYLLRYQPGTSRSWGNAIPLHNGEVTNSPYDMLVVPSGPVVLMVKAVDSSGNESENAAYIVANFGDPLIANIVETFDRKAAGFPGVKTNCTVSGGNLVADSITPLMWNPVEAAAMWGADPSALMWATTQYAPMTYVDSLSFSQAGVGSILTIEHTVAGDPWSLEYRENSGQLMWDADSAKLMWNTDAGALMWDQPAFLPWPGQIAVKNSFYDFRISAGQASTQGVVSEFTLIVDMPDIEEDLNDIVISSGGTRLPIVKSYRAIKNVQLTVQADGGSAISARIDDKNPSLGPLIHGLDASGANTSALVDARVQGY